MTIFDGLKHYAGKWSVKGEPRKFTQEEISLVREAVVVASEYGNSVCFFLHSGGMSFIPLSNTCTKGIGETVDLTKASIVTLEKQGEADITRIEC